MHVVVVKCVETRLCKMYFHENLSLVLFSAKETFYLSNLEERSKRMILTEETHLPTSLPSLIIYRMDLQISFN